MTYLQLVNAVLRRLRVNQASSVRESDYVRMIGDFVNEAKREVEDAWDWLALDSESTYVMSVAKHTPTDTHNSFTATGLGKRSKIKEILNLGSLANNNKGGIGAIDHRRMDRLLRFSDDVVASPQRYPTGVPVYWRVFGYDGDDPIIQLYPEPDKTYIIGIYAIVPQVDLANDGDKLSIPDWPVILGAHVRAVTERGDDRGAPLPILQQGYEVALGDAITADAGNRNDGRATDWMLA